MVEAQVIDDRQMPAAELRVIRSDEPWPSRAGRGFSRAVLQFMAVACMSALIVLAAMMTYLVKDALVPSWMVFAGMFVLLVAGGAFVCAAVMMDE